jgi:hypothetical protein
MPYFYHLDSGQTLSIVKLRQALQLIVAKHQSLRTSLIFDVTENRLKQRIIALNDNRDQLFAFIESTFKTDEQLNNIMCNETCNSQLFDLVQGLVFRCHIVYYNEISSKNLVCDKDAIIFNFHHALFDSLSMDVFLRDFNQAYTEGQLKTNHDHNILHYIDCKYRHLFIFLFKSYNFYFLLYIQMLLSNNKCQWQPQICFGLILFLNARSITH